MTEDVRQNARDRLAAAAALYEDYLELTRITIDATTGIRAQNEFFSPNPAPLALSLIWRDDALVELSP
jgi:hypothetical protein